MRRSGLTPPAGLAGSEGGRPATVHSSPSLAAPQRRPCWGPWAFRRRFMAVQSPGPAEGGFADSRETVNDTPTQAGGGGLPCAL